MYMLFRLIKIEYFLKAGRIRGKMNYYDMSAS